MSLKNTKTIAFVFLWRLVDGRCYEAEICCVPLEMGFCLQSFGEVVTSNISLTHRLLKPL